MKRVDRQLAGSARLGPRSDGNQVVASITTFVGSAISRALAAGAGRRWIVYWTLTSRAARSDRAVPGLDLAGAARRRCGGVPLEQSSSVCMPLPLLSTPSQPSSIQPFVVVVVRR